MTDEGDPPWEIQRQPTEAVDAVADLWVDFVADQRQHGSHLLAEPNRARIREAALRGIVTDSLLVASRGDDPVGFVTFSVESGVYDQDVSRGLVENVYVVPESRDEGVGSALLAAAEDRLRERGCEVFFLEVLAANEGARRFYREAGYDLHRLQFERPADDTESPYGSEVDTESDTHTRDD